jgi:hypothetical protein
LEFLKEKAVEATKQNEEKRKKPKPEEHEGMPQHHHCPPAKRRGDRSWKTFLIKCVVKRSISIGN